MTGLSLVGIQRRYTEIGRIRLGEKKSKGGKTYPARLATIRLTSPNLDAIKVAAEHYGGSVEAWEGQYQVITGVDRIPIAIPPRPTGAAPYSLAYELWSGGGCQRRCDGAEATIYAEGGFSVAPCVCAELDERECDPTLRVSLLIPELPGFGTWRLETHGFNAAAELPGMLDLIASYGVAQPIPAVLRIEQRTSKRGGQTRHYSVPVIDLGFSLLELAGGSAPQIAPRAALQLVDGKAAPVPAAAAVPQTKASSSSQPLWGEEPPIPGDEEAVPSSTAPEPAAPPGEAKPQAPRKRTPSPRARTSAPPEPRTRPGDPDYPRNRAFAVAADRGLDGDALKRVAIAKYADLQDPEAFNRSELTAAQWQELAALVERAPEQPTITSATQFARVIAKEQGIGAGFKDEFQVADPMAAAMFGKPADALEPAEWIEWALRASLGDVSVAAKS